MTVIFDPHDWDSAIDKSIYTKRSLARVFRRIYLVQRNQYIAYNMFLIHKKGSMSSSEAYLGETDETKQIEIMHHY